MSVCSFILARKNSLRVFGNTAKVVLLIQAVFTGVSFAAEWKLEPSIFLNTQYNDNLSMQSEQNKPEASTGFAINPRLKFSGEEQSLWDVSVDIRGRVARYQDIEDADSEDVFFAFDGGRNTELSAWRMGASFDRNTNFDTDYDTQNPDAGILDDRTERKTATLEPSVRWSVSETSQMSFSMTSIGVSYDETITQNVQDYDYNSAQSSIFWRIGENHQLGFTGAYSEYDSPEANFSWDNTELSLDYTYTLSNTSKLSLTVGGRKLVSLVENATTACIANGITVPINAFPNDGTCPALLVGFPTTSVFSDVEGEDSGTVSDFSYVSQSETSSHSITGGRTVIPSSFGSAQEQLRLSYLFSIKNTERLSIKLIFDANETETLSGINSSNDRTLYRFEPSVTYSLSKNWGLIFIYRYIDQNLTDSDTDSSSSAVYLNLNLRWPKLASTY